MTDPNIDTSLKSMVAEPVASALLRIGAIKINVADPFTWVSGIKSPIYCDNRLVNSDVEARKVVIDGFVSEIRRLFPEVEVIAGVATGGISFGALIADKMGLPYIYVRQAPKEHGLKKQIEGHAEPGQKVVLIEDHISTGGSSLKAVDGLRNENLECLALISVMTYGFPVAAERFNKSNVTFMSLSNLDEAVEVASSKGLISADDREEVLRFRDDPQGWA